LRKEGLIGGVEIPVFHRHHPLLIRHGEVLNPVRPEPVEGYKFIHISTSSMRTDFKHNLTGSIGYRHSIGILIFTLVIQQLTHLSHYLIVGNIGALIIQ
jgi:hypothetical protein